MFLALLFQLEQDPLAQVAHLDAVLEIGLVDHGRGKAVVENELRDRRVTTVVKHKQIQSQGQGQTGASP